ncbi:MAG TPA: hypothetical protein VLU73_16305, partial [Methylococcaceae bacterium]|nr:hypothetical protein [Methylococcaceae bacterium]
MPVAVAQSASLWEDSALSLLQRFEAHPVIREIEAALTGGEIVVRFREGEDTLLSVDIDSGIMDMSVMHGNGPRHGLKLLLGLGWVYVLLCRGGRSERAALHGMLDLYQAMSAEDQADIFRSLEQPVLDPGKLFALFLQRAGSADSAEDRDRHVTWLLGQNRVNLPYDRLAALAIMGGAADTDEKRRQLYALVRNYDRALECGNIERISCELREAGELLIFGRMSRAFHNQGMLFADAVLIRSAPDWPGFAGELAELAAGDDDTEETVARLRLFLNSPGEVPLIRLEGALERFEDAALDAQRRALAQTLNSAREWVENHADRFAPAPPAFAADAIFSLAEQRLQLAERIRTSILAAKRRPAAYVVISQRPSPTGSHLLVKLNDFEDPYPGKPDNLRKLLRLAGDRVYGSPDYGWLEVADHWIEAIPLFIREEVLTQDGRETSRTVIDIAGMEESFREEMADLWANNLRRVLESEFLALARETLTEGSADADEEAVRSRLLAEGVDPAEIAALGLLFGEAYRQQVAEVQRLVEREELEPFEAARLVLPKSAIVNRARERFRAVGSWRGAVADVLRASGRTGDFEREIARLVPAALTPRRPLPALHVLTTQSAGMTEGYVRSWLEESMALYNIVEDHGLHEDVEACRRFHVGRISALAEKLIRELGLWVEVEELRSSESVSEAEAIRRIVRRNSLVQEGISCLGTLLEFEQATVPAGEADRVDDPESVRAILQSEVESLRDIALDQVVERNGDTLTSAARDYCSQNPGSDQREALRRIVTNDEYYRCDLDAYCRIAARRRVLDRLDAEHPELHLQARCNTFLRRYQSLAKTTARKEIIAERGLNHLTLHPLHYFRATGGGKRYHLLYTPSRVDLGRRERESVETWAQWVGGADQAAAREGRRLYGLINKDVRVFASLREPEVLKTGENASMTSHYAFSNALSMMVAATRRGDFESMADQMNRRQDRRVHPAGEGYGGYCVPKDGLFLEFVLSLGRGEKLVQIGLPAACHDAVAQLAEELLERRGEFASELDWEAWAACRMQALEWPLSGTRSRMDLFQATRVAQLLDGLGQPELRDAGRVATSLAARWGLHKMVTGGEQVNRFMPFFKVWLIRQALAESARRHPDSGPDAERAVVVLTAEYKPDTQDGRFSAGMRKLEILAGTGNHLLSALDSEGQDLALLLSEGYAQLERRGRVNRVLDWLDIDPTDEAAIARLRELFPFRESPAEIRLVSPTGLSIQDVLNYTSDTRLAEIAEQTRTELLDYGFSAREIEANLRSHGPRLRLWSHRLPLAPKERDDLQQRLGGRIHALALTVLGPEFHYPHALQGADVLDTGIPHQCLLELLADPGYLCDLMLDGNPRSALAIVDGASGARPRALNQLDVMLWFAAGERRGRESVYCGIGLGEETIESWRATMRRRRRQAESLRQALGNGSANQARRVYGKIVRDLRQDEIAQAELDELGKRAHSGRLQERDRAYAEALIRVAGGLPIEDLDFAGFLALGGIFLLIGADREEIVTCQSSVTFGIASLAGRSAPFNERWMALLPPADRRLGVPDYREERGVESSNKAMEERPAVALETRRQLAGRLARARAINERYAAFSAASAQTSDFAASYRAAMDCLGSGDGPVAESAFGRFMAHAGNALGALAVELADGEHRGAFLSRLKSLCGGRRIDPELWQDIAGGYEDIGDFGRLAQSVAERRQRGQIEAGGQGQALERIARAGELFQILLAVDSIQELLDDAPADPLPVWRALADFFAKTLNDHHYEYRPWLYSRGIGFARLTGEELYQWAVTRHAWLYRYLRGIAIRCTELRELPEDQRDSLLGNFLDGKSLEAIGAEADSPAERAWRAYGQIRELAFMRNDGFPLPIVFPQFDPDLIEDRSRTNHVIAAPVGRTHFARMLREGPTLSRELEREGRPGANLIIGRKLDFHAGTGEARSVASIRSGHLYLDAETYRAALSRYRPGAAMAEVHPKGVRVAARFTRPVLAGLVYPFHGDPAYTSGALEAAGLPYTVQSLFHTWTTYDKAKYSDIFKGSGVELPAEIDWLAA